MNYIIADGRGGGGQSDCNDMIALTRANSSDRTSAATQDATHPVETIMSNTRLS